MADTVIPRAAQINEKEILTKPSFKKDLQALAEQQEEEYEVIQSQAVACLQEMAAQPRDGYLFWFHKLARFISTRSYESELDVNEAQLARLKELSTSHPVVFLWSHKSHLDGFAFMRTLYEHDFRPQPLSFAGANMNFAGFGKLVKGSGGVFIRRSFADDEVYKLVFKHYIDYLVEKKAPLSWSIEGTRSRTGKLMPPKMGLISWVLGAYHRAHNTQVLLVPVSISFDQIAEIDDYIAMQSGLPKRKESALWFLSYIFGMKKAVGKIYLRFAEPVRLSDDMHVPDAMFSEDVSSENKHISNLVFEVCRRIEQGTPVSNTNLSAMIILAGNDNAITPKQLCTLAKQIEPIIQRRDLPTASELILADTDGTRAQMDKLVESALLMRQPETDGYSINPEKVLALTYYRNTISHYFIEYAIAELALAHVDSTASEDQTEDFWLAIMQLRDLLKFEFFFAPKPEFKQSITVFLNHHYPQWINYLQSKAATQSGLYKENIPILALGILRSFLEAYQIAAHTTLDAGEQPIKDQGAAINNCMDKGKKMLKSTEGGASVLSQSIFTTALQYADHRGLLGAGATDLSQARQAFGREMDGWVATLNQLQHYHDELLA